MTTPLPESDANSATNNEQRLAELLEQLVDQAAHGNAPDFESIVRAHPDLAKDLRELWATAMIAEDFGSFTGELGDLTGAAEADANTSPTALNMPAEIGDFELLEEIGRGGMGVVFKARQKSLGRVVALKMVLRGEMASSIDVARFRTEAESASRLSHPGIVPVYDVSEHEGLPYFSMKYIEGTTLAQKLSGGPLPPHEAAEILQHVAQAIADAHETGLLHRDLKPSNILIDGDGRSYVSDFGLAKYVSPATTDKRVEEATAANWATGLTLSGAILGTPGYMAPEQAAGERGEIGPATDVYGLGAILFAMITGQPPFRAATPLDTVLMVLEQDVPLPRTLNHDVDPDLEMIALKCLQKPTDLRYASAKELAGDLKAYLDNEPISARSSQFTQVVSRAFRETHHAGVLENWGLLWMWHSLVLLLLCLTTNGLQLSGVTSRWLYAGLWGVGLGIWAAFFWNVRRRGGPITFVERQVAHVWAGSVICTTLLFAVEALLGLRVLELSPVLALVSGMVFLVKAGILTGRFYVQSLVLFLTAAVMAMFDRSDMPPLGISVFGIVSAACFFFPGLKYYRQRVRRAPSHRRHG